MAELRRRVKAAPGEEEPKTPDEDTPAMPSDMAEQEMEHGGMHEEPDGDEDVEPFGAQVLRRIHQDHSILMQEYDEMMEVLEHEGVKTHLQAQLEKCEACLTETEDLFEGEYSHLKPLEGGMGGSKGMEESSPAEEDMDEEEGEDVEQLDESGEGEEEESNPEEEAGEEEMRQGDEGEAEHNAEEAEHGEPESEEEMVEDEEPVKHISKKKHKERRLKYQKKGVAGRVIGGTIGAIGGAVAGGQALGHGYRAAGRAMGHRIAGEAGATAMQGPMATYGRGIGEGAGGVGGAIAGQHLGNKVEEWIRGGKKKPLKKKKKDAADEMLQEAEAVNVSAPGLAPLEDHEKSSMKEAANFLGEVANTQTEDWTPKHQNIAYGHHMALEKIAHIVHDGGESERDVEQAEKPSEGETGEKGGIAGAARGALGGMFGPGTGAVIGATGALDSGDDKAMDLEPSEETHHPSRVAAHAGATLLSAISGVTALGDHHRGAAAEMAEHLHSNAGEAVEEAKDDIHMSAGSSEEQAPEEAPGGESVEHVGDMDTKTLKRTMLKQDEAMQALTKKLAALQSKLTANGVS